MTDRPRPGSTPPDRPDADRAAGPARPRTGSAAAGGHPTEATPTPRDVGAATRGTDGGVGGPSIELTPRLRARIDHRAAETGAPGSPPIDGNRPAGTRQVHDDAGRCTAYRTVFYSDQERRAIDAGVAEDIRLGHLAEDRQDEAAQARLDQLCEARARKGQWFTPEPFDSADDVIGRGAVLPEWHSHVDHDRTSTSGINARQYELSFPETQLRYLSVAAPQTADGPPGSPRRHADLEGGVIQMYVPAEAGTGAGPLVVREVGFPPRGADGQPIQRRSDEEAREVHLRGRELRPLATEQEAAIDMSDVWNAARGSHWEQGALGKD